MRLRTIATLTLALAAASSQATVRYDFSYTGLYHTGAFPHYDAFEPNAYMGGYFVGEDANGDGTFQAQELTDLALTLNPNASDEAMEHFIGPDANCYEGCLIYGFEYTPGNKLVFHVENLYPRARYSYSNERYLKELYGGDVFESFTVTPDTHITVSIEPEPGMTAKMLTGLAGLAYAGRRNARGTRAPARIPASKEHVLAQ